MSVYNTQEIMDILPHRHPFLLIDTIEELEPGVRAVGRKNVTFNEPYFAGHFPGNPVMPGVLIMEALAQTGAVAILSKPENKGRIAYFGGIDKCRFKGKVQPGDNVLLYTDGFEEEMKGYKISNLCKEPLKGMSKERISQDDKTCIKLKFL